MYQKWPDHIFPTVNFVFSDDGPFGLGGGEGANQKVDTCKPGVMHSTVKLIGGGGGLLLWLSAVPMLFLPRGVFELGGKGVMRPTHGELRMARTSSAQRVRGRAQGRATAPAPVRTMPESTGAPLHCVGTVCTAHDFDEVLLETVLERHQTDGKLRWMSPP